MVSREIEPSIGKWPPEIGGDPEAIEAATRIREGQPPIRLRGGWGTITPAWAEENLKGALAKIAPAEDASVHHMAEDMAAVRWRPTGEALIFTHDNLLLDGKKRLAACVKSGVPFVSLIIHGVPIDAYDTMNNLRGRRMEDILKVKNEMDLTAASDDEVRRVHHRYRTLSTILKLLWRMRDGGYDTKPLGSDRRLLQMLDTYPGILRSIDRAELRPRVIHVAPFGAADFLLRHIDAEVAERFFKDMSDDAKALRVGAPEDRCPMGHPVRVLHDVILHYRSTRSIVAFEKDKRKLMASIVLAWNAFYDQTAPKDLVWEPTGEDGKAQEFPTPSGWQPEMALLQLRTAEEELAAAAAHATSTVSALSEVHVGAVDIMSEFERHPRSEEIWHATFPDGIIPPLTLRMLGRPEGMELLGRNTANRGKMPATVARYRRDIESRNFQSTNGQTIKIARTGRLLDGQHRITAIAESDVRLPFLVVDQLEEHVFEAMDRAQTKPFSKVLGDRKISNAGGVAAAARLQFLYERNGFKALSGFSISNPELDDVVTRHPGLVEAVEFHNRLRGLLVQRVATWIEYQLKKADPEKAIAFLDKLASGEELSRGNPILVLRNRLLSMETARLKANRRGKPEEGEGGAYDVRLAAMTILAFNAWVAGKTIGPGALTWAGAAEEPFPLPDAVPPEPEAGSARKRKSKEPPASEEAEGSGEAD